MLKFKINIKPIHRPKHAQGHPVLLHAHALHTGGLIAKAPHEAHLFRKPCVDSLRVDPLQESNAYINGVVDEGEPHLQKTPTNANKVRLRGLPRVVVQHLQQIHPVLRGFLSLHHRRHNLAIWRNARLSPGVPA